MQRFIGLDRRNLMSIAADLTWIAVKGLPLEVSLLVQGPGTMHHFKAAGLFLDSETLEVDLIFHEAYRIAI